MTISQRSTTLPGAGADTQPGKPRFGGVLWRAARATTGLMRPFAGRRWMPVFAVLRHRGRRTGREYSTPVAARRTADGFVISLAFGGQVDWYRNLLAAGRGTIRWRGEDHPVGGPVPIDAATGLGAFNLVQRLALRLGRIDGFVRVRDR